MRIGLWTAAAALFCGLPVVQAATLIPVPSFPGSTYTAVTGINNLNVVTGRYLTSDGQTHGFFGSLDGAYQSFDYPTGGTAPLAINDDGYISGLASPSGENHIGDEFIRRPDGTFATIMGNGVPLDGQAKGFEDRVSYVGDYWIFDDNDVGTDYGYIGKRGKWQQDVRLPVDTTSTAARDIDKNGTIVGHFINGTGGGRHGFVLRNGSVQVVTYPDPNVTAVLLEGINDHGIAAGSWIGNDGIEHAFLYDINVQKFRDIKIRGATNVDASSINNAGLVTLSVDGAPYVYCSHKNRCPGAGAGNAKKVAGNWFHAPPGSIRTLMCQHDCLGPRHPAPVGSNAELKASSPLR